MRMEIKMRNFIIKKTAQSILEYAILIGVVSAALLAISLYVRRAIQANLKIIEYQINSEVNQTTP